MSATTKKKYVAKEVLEDFSFPKENQFILRIVKPRGNNLHQVATTTGEEFLVSMPPKFRNHIWIKRNDYVIAESIPEGNKVRGEIVRILLKEQIKYFKENNIWPEAFSEKRKEDNGYQMDEDLLPKCSDSDDDSETDKIVRYNPNKYLPEVVCSDSSSDESDDNDEFGDNSENSDETDENSDDADENSESDPQHDLSGDLSSLELSSKNCSDK